MNIEIYNRAIIGSRVLSSDIFSNSPSKTLNDHRPRPEAIANLTHSFRIFCVPIFEQTKKKKIQNNKI